MSTIIKTVYSKNNHSLLFPPAGPPASSVSASTFSFGTVKLLDFSASQSFNVSGSNLTGNMTITAPAGFILNTDNSNSDMGPLVFVPVNGSVNETVFVKFAPMVYQVYAPDDITIASTGTTTLNITVDGTGTLQSELKTWYDNLVGAKPTDPLTLSLQRFYQTLEDGGVIGQSDLLHLILGLQTAEQRLTPVKTTGASPTVAVNAPLLDATGVKGDGAASYLNLKWVPDTDAVKYQQDDCSSFFYSRTAVGSGKSGSKETGKSDNSVEPRNADTKCYFGSNTDLAGSIDRFVVTDGKGLYCIKRTGAATPVLKKNGNTLYTGVANSDSLTTLEEYLGAVNDNGVATDFSNHKYCLYGRGSSSVNDVLIYQALNNYATELGITL